MAISLFYVVLCRLIRLFTSRRRTEVDREVELTVLGHELRILRRQARGRVGYRARARMILATGESRALPVAMAILPRHARDAVAMAS
jgi:hypothetical protein